MKDNVQSRSIVICFISYSWYTEANAARFVKTHRIYNTKYDDPGTKPKIAPKQHENPQFYTAPQGCGLKLLLSPARFRWCFYFAPCSLNFRDTSGPPGCGLAVAVAVAVAVANYICICKTMQHRRQFGWISFGTDSNRNFNRNLGRIYIPLHCKVLEHVGLARQPPKPALGPCAIMAQS